MNVIGTFWWAMMRELIHIVCIENVLCQKNYLLKILGRHPSTAPPLNHPPPMNRQTPLKTLSSSLRGR